MGRIEDFFQAIHSPAGADAGFSLGYWNHGGGFGMEIERIKEQDVFIGIRRKKEIRCFPFFQEAESAQIQSFVKKEGEEQFHRLKVFSLEEVTREFGYGSDLFHAEGISFELIHPVRELPDPERAEYDRCREAFTPAILARMIIDNTDGTEEAEGIFAVSPMKGKLQLGPKTGGKLKGFLSNDNYGFAVLGSEQVEEFCDFSLARAYDRPKKMPFLIAALGGIAIKAAPGEKKEVMIALGWYRKGIITSGSNECSFYYTRFFPDLLSVLTYALEKRETLVKAAEENNQFIRSKGFTKEREFLLIQSTKSYYVSTMLFDDGGSPRWVVNEGSYRMMNTFDLTVDHSFFELRYQPWAVRNQLDSYLLEYSYHDQCGITFTHDQGTHYVFSPFGYSSYEMPDLDDCFSYMSQEQLCNWILTAALYVHKTRDNTWALNRQAAFMECFRSMLHRDSRKGNYNGIMRIDSSRCDSGQEITTYDSLDSSLGQARENLYLAVKCWASYLALETLFYTVSDKEGAERASAHARLCADTICSYFRKDLGYIPAVFDGKDQSAIIPAIEALVYPKHFGREDALKTDGSYGAFIEILKRHTEAVLVPGRCLFPDGGWKLSGNSINSWMSKIFLCEYVAENVLQIRHDYGKCDKAHAGWWRKGCPSNPGIDQILNGTQEETGFHYPRCVTSTLWW